MNYELRFRRVNKRSFRQPILLLGLVLLITLLFAAPQTVYGQMTVPAKCPDVVGGVDYCPTMPNATRCSIYGQSPSCADKAEEITPTNKTNISCDSCTFVCQSGWTDCSGGIGLGSDGCETQSQIGQSCTMVSGQSGTYAGNACSPTCSPTAAYVSRQFSSPGTAESGFMYIEGDIKSSAGDIYLVDGKSISVNGSGTTNLHIGNWGTGGTGVTTYLWGDVKVGGANFERKLAVFGGVGIGTDTIEPSALLDLNGSFNFSQKGFRGFLPPRLTTAQRNTIGSPAQGLLIFNTNDREYNFFGASGWESATPWKQSSSTKKLSYLLGNVGVGTADPAYNFDVAGKVNASEGLCINGDCKANWSEVGGGAGGGATGGCFGSVFVGMTGSAVNGSQAGYNSADSLCATAVSGSHVCTTSEILNSKSCKSAVFTTQSSGDAWVLNGPPGFTANANDCIGRTSASGGDFGSFWLFNSQGGQGWLSPCNQTHKLACCK